jgi:DNA polymerase elongation subunit (family B)
MTTNNQLTDLTSSNQLTIFPFDFIAEDDAKTNTLNIHIWGLNRKSEPHLLIVNNYPAYCYLEVPELNEENRQLVLNYIYHHIPDLVNSSYQQLNKLYYYQPNKTNFLLLAFKNLKSLSLLEKLIKSNSNVFPLSDDTSIRVQLYENEVSMVRKFLSYLKLNFSQWFKCNAEIDGNKISTLKNEYLINYDSIIPVADIESINWNISPKILSMRMLLQGDIISDISIITTELNPTTKRNVYQYGINNNTGTTMPVNSEKELIEKIFFHILSFDPDIIVGYELFNKLYPILDKRVRLNKIKYPNLSRIKNGTTEIKYRKWQSSAYGYNEIHNLIMEGRISLDIYSYIKRTTKLEQYHLDRVLMHFDINVDEKNNDTQITVLNHAVLDLFYKTEMWIDMIELSNIVGVSMVDLFTRGEQVRLFSLIYDACVRNRIVLNYENQPDIEVEGSYNFAVDAGIYENTLWFDFERLYPSLIIANNICYTTLINSPEENTKLTHNKINTITGINKKQVFQSKFVKPEVKVGILPKILKEKIQQRNDTKNEIKKESDISVKKRLMKREKILKATTNAFYGFLAIQQEKGTLSLIIAAITITSLGRELTQSINEKIEMEFEAKILYNDTDSIVIQLPENKEKLDSQELYKKGNEIVNVVNADLQDPIKLAFDYVARFALLKQKKYALLVMNPDGSFKDVPIKKGLVVGRSDSCEFLEQVYEKVLDNILLKVPAKDTFALILNQIERLDENKVPFDQLAMVKKINTKYAANSTYFLKKFLDRLLDKGIKIPLGSDIEFVVVQKGNKVAVADKMELLEMVKPTDVPDTEYYIENVLQNPIDQLWQLGYKDNNNVNVTYKPPKSRKKAVPLNEPVHVIALQYSSGLKLEDLKNLYNGGK